MTHNRNAPVDSRGTRDLRFRVAQQTLTLTAAQPALSLRQHLPDLGLLITRYADDADMRKTARHNANVLRCVRGGLRMAEQQRIRFEPRDDYWRLPERRFAIAYLADQWTGRSLPAESVRAYAVHLLRHFERAREDGTISYKGVDYETLGGLGVLTVQLAEHAHRMSTPHVWQELRRAHSRLPAAAADHVVQFLRTCEADRKWEASFGRRLPWFAYLGARSVEEALERQRFFFGYANLWTTSNAYKLGGAQSFASVLQNTPTETCLDYASRWRDGLRPSDTKFYTLSRDDVAVRDRSDHTPVLEIFGFLNLQREPFYNTLAEAYWDWLGASTPRGDPQELMRQVSGRTLGWLGDHPASVEALAKLLIDLTSGDHAIRVRFETIDSVPLRRRPDGAGASLLDESLRRELSECGAADIAAMSREDQARTALHLLLDAQLYRWGALGDAVIPPISVRPPIIAPTPANDTLPPPVLTPSPELRKLPETLRPYGERALRYLHAGMHVVFAGAPGTGKTTLAQFVGYAWDHQRRDLLIEMPVASAPLTTVGSSAWSPFHTIGGLVPSATGHGYQLKAGLFIDPTSEGTSTWFLRNGAVVLDEMNRADLDRCIGELYPLLSGSVAQVCPAGLVGIGSIAMSPRFRVLATINDRSVDDIVFPISEGLARRFQRIEIGGASEDDVLTFLGVSASEPHGARERATSDAVGELFARAREEKLLDGEAERLPVGAAYFGLLRAWLQGVLDLGADKVRTDDELATELIVEGCASLKRKRGWDSVLGRMGSDVDAS